MITAWQAGKAKIISGVKRQRGKESLVTTLTSRGFYRLFGALTGNNVRGASDFKLLDRQVIDQYCALSERNLYFRGMIDWLGYKQMLIAFDVAPRLDGKSGWSLISRFRLAMDAVTSFSSAPLQLVTVLGLIFLGLAGVIILQTLINWLSGNAVEGFTTVILLLLIIGSALMLSLGIIGQYLAKIYAEIKNRPRYIIAENILQPSPEQLEIKPHVELNHALSKDIKPRIKPVQAGLKAAQQHDLFLYLVMRFDGRCRTAFLNIALISLHKAIAFWRFRP